MKRFWGWMLVCAVGPALFASPAYATEADILDAFARGRVQEAMDDAWALVQLRRADPGPNSLEAAKAVELLYEVVTTPSDSPTDSLAAWLAQAQATRERLFGENSPEVLPSLWRRCSLLRRMRQNEAVIELVERGKAIVNQNENVPDPYRMEMLVAEGDLAYARRDVKTATPLHEAALVIAAAMERPPADQVARVWLRLAYDRARSGEVLESLRLTERALELYESLYGPHAGNAATALNHRATLLGDLNRPAEAIASNERATQIYRRNLGADHPFLGGMFNNLGNLLSAAGDYRRAAAAYEESIRIRTEAYGPDHPLLAQSHLNFGRCLTRQARFEEALEVYEGALASLRKNSRANGRLLVKVLTNLSATYNHLGRFDDSRLVVEEAIDLIESNLGPSHLSLALPLINLAVMERFQGNLEESLAAAERAIQIQVDSYGEANADLVVGYDAIAITRFWMGDVDGAIRNAMLDEDASRSRLQSMARGFSESSANSAAQVRDTMIPTLLRIGATLDASQSDLLESVVEEAFRSRGLVLEQAMGRRRRLLGRDDDATRLAIQKMEATRSELLSHLATRPTPTEQESYGLRREELRDAVDEAEDEYARVDFAEAEAQRQLHLAEIRDALPPRSAMVSYWYLRPVMSFADSTGRYVATVTRKDSVKIFDLGDAVRIDRDISQWREALETLPSGGQRDPERLALELGKRVRERLWDPILVALDQTDLVLIVPDDQLHFVPFAALPHDDGEYLVEKGPTVHLLSSERDLLSRDEFARTEDSGLLVLGGADFDAAAEETQETAQVLPANLRSISDCVSFRSMEFEPLPATRTEAATIARLWKEEFDDVPLVLSGSDAREEVVRAEASHYSTLHFATHGFFLGGECEESSPRLRGVGGLAPSWSSADAVEETFRLSGLALAGANERKSRGQGSADGILTAEEIATLDLRGVEWAVLSACDTGLGDLVRAEGVLGLRRSFRLAGAATVISSLWAVEDEATQTWMKELYRARLQDGLDTATAVRQASLRVLSARRAAGQSTHPFYWASFAGSGRWE